MYKRTFLLALFTSSNPVANGDVQLAVDGQINVWRGELQVYLNGVWGTVCSVGFNNGSADAACREMARTQHRRWSTLKEMK